MKENSKVVQIILEKLTPRQMDIYRAWLDKSIDYVTVSCGRQVGKTQTLMQITIQNGLKPLHGQPFCAMGVFLPVNKQAKMVFNRTRKILQKYDGFDFNKTELSIRFPNGSTIQYWTSENDNCRGNTYDYLFADEACFIKGELWYEAIIQTVLISLSKKKGKVLLTSTPKEKNWFYDYFVQSKKNYKSIKFTSEESQLQSKEVLEDIKRITPISTWRNEYLAEFVDGALSTFDVDRATKIEPSEISNYTAIVAGIDWGIENDYTVLTLINSNKECFYVRKWRKIPWDEIISEIIKDLRTHGSPVCYAEKNGIGNMPTAELKRLYGSVKPVVTTADSKTKMIMKLAKDILSSDSSQLRLLNDAELLKEMNNYGATYVNGIAKYGNINKEIHDDMVMSLAIANYNYKTFEISFGI